MITFSQKLLLMRKAENNPSLAFMELVRLMEEQMKAMMDMKMKEMEENHKSEMLEMEKEMKNELLDEIPDYSNVIEKLKGSDGKDSEPEEVAGVIYKMPEFHKEIKSFIPSPINGKDYILTEKDKKEIASKITVPIVEKVIEKIKVIEKQPMVTEITKVTNEIKEVAKTDKPLEIADKLNTTEESVNQSVIKGLTNFLKNIQRSIKEKSGGINRGGGDIMYVEDLTSQCNGVLKTFTVPKHRKAISLLGTQFPIIYRPTIDWTTSGTILTLTSEVGAPETSQTLVFTYIV